MSTRPRWAGVLLLVLLVTGWTAAQDTVYRPGQIFTTGPAPPGSCTTGGVYIVTVGSPALHVCTATNVWTELAYTGGGGGGVPAGSILLIDSGTCPATYTEVSGLDGRTLVGTVAANSNVGTTGGADTISAVVNHTHTVNVTDPGHTHVETNNSATTGGLAGWGARDTSTNTQVVTGYSTSSATTGVTASTVNPSGGVASFDNRSAFTRIIFCKKD